MRRKISNPLIFFVFSCFSLWLISSPAFSEQIVINSDEQYQYGRSLMEKGAYETAIHELKRFIHLFPDDARLGDARFLTGLCYLNARRFEEAREVFLKLAAPDPEPDAACRALLGIGESYYRQRVYSEAEHYLNRVINKHPCESLRSEAFYRLGWTRMQTGRWHDAAGAFNHVEIGTLYYESAQSLAMKSLAGESLPKKNPTRAGTLAAVVPGLGHVYVYRYRDALTAFVLNGVFIWATIESFQRDHEVLGGILGALELGWYTGNIYSAVNCTHKYNRKIRDDFIESLTDRFRLGVSASAEGHLGFSLQYRF